MDSLLPTASLALLPVAVMWVAQAEFAARALAGYLQGFSDRTCVIDGGSNTDYFVGLVGRCEKGAWVPYGGTYHCISVAATCVDVADSMGLSEYADRVPHVQVVIMVAYWRRWHMSEG